MCGLIQVIELIKETVGDPRVKIELIDGFDPLPVSSSDEKSFGFQIIKKTVLDMFPAVTVAPGRSHIFLIVIIWIILARGLT